MTSQFSGFCSVSSNDSREARGRSFWPLLYNKIIYRPLVPAVPCGPDHLAIGILFQIPVDEACVLIQHVAIVHS